MAADGTANDSKTDAAGFLSTRDESFAADRAALVASIAITLPRLRRSADFPWLVCDARIVRTLRTAIRPRTRVFAWVDLL